MNPDHKIDFKYLLNKILTGKLTEVEKDELREFILNSYQDSELEIFMREHWTGIENKEFLADDIQMLNLKNQILTRINWVDNSSNSEPRTISKNLMNYFMRAAAILILPLLLGSIFVFYRMQQKMEKLTVASVIQQVMANPGSRVHFTLPDQSEVWLNSGSMLEFPLDLNQQDQRKVKLTGQGYFKVSHDSTHPFFVETERLLVKDMGTSFDVSNYADDQEISSTLEEGSIVLLSLEGTEITRIVPGQKAILDKTTNKIAVNEVETVLTTSWKDGKLIFKNTSLDDLAVKLERWFNCEIHIDPALSQSKLLYTATIQDETLGEVLKMIEISTSVKTRIEKREVYIGKK